MVEAALSCVSAEQRTSSRAFAVVPWVTAGLEEGGSQREAGAQSQRSDTSDSVSLPAV